jgi:leader peptidase (prepilin peptidase)/N-methyltransferase
MASDRGLAKWEAIGCAVSGIVAALACSRFMPPEIALLSGYLFSTAAAITIIDYRIFIIPDSLSIPAIPVGVIASLAPVDPQFYPEAAAYSLAGAAVGGGSFYLIRSSYRYLRGFEGLGMGDVKLAAAAGAWVGIEGLPLVLLAATAAAVSAVAVRHVGGRAKEITRVTPVPFGSFLAPALWVIWLYRELVPFS